MSPDSQIEYLMPVLGRLKARLAFKIASEHLEQDLDGTFGDPLQFLAKEYGERSAVAFAVRFSATALSHCVRHLAYMVVYRKFPVPPRKLLKGLQTRSLWHKMSRWLALLSSEERAEDRAVAIARRRARLGDKDAGGLHNMIGNPFRYLSERLGEEGAVSFLLRFEIESIGSALTALALLKSFKEDPPTHRQVINSMANRVDPPNAPGALESWTGDRSLAHLVLAIARTKARLGAKAAGKDIETALGDPFRFVADEIGEQPAVAFFLQFDLESIASSLAMGAEALQYRRSPPEFAEILRATGATRQFDHDELPLLTDKIQ